MSNLLLNNFNKSYQELIEYIKNLENENEMIKNENEKLNNEIEKLKNTNINVKDNKITVVHPNNLSFMYKTLYNNIFKLLFKPIFKLCYIVEKYNKDNFISSKHRGFLFKTYNEVRQLIDRYYEYNSNFDMCNNSFDKLSNTEKEIFNNKEKNDILKNLNKFKVIIPYLEINSDGDINNNKKENSLKIYEYVKNNLNDEFELYKENLTEEDLF